MTFWQHTGETLGALLYIVSGNIHGYSWATFKHLCRDWFSVDSEATKIFCAKFGWHHAPRDSCDLLLYITISPLQEVNICLYIQHECREQERSGSEVDWVLQ